MKKLLPFALLCLLFTLSCIAQPLVKSLQATKASTSPKIDGILDDDAWKNVPIATDFVELNPVAGRHEQAANHTEIKVIYDNDAIYVAARLFEDGGASKVAHEIAPRDQIGNADFIGIVLDTYHDGINASGFYVTAAGVQFDAKYAPNPNGNSEDANWNAVWQSAVKIDDKGWTAEFKIPYSALRFAKAARQTWGLNFVRKRQKAQQQLFWNELNPKKNGFINQEGVLNGIEDITPPVRLAFYPYLSTYVNHYPYNTPGVSNTQTSVNGGMDVKWGITDAFTLDMTLIPDFGQVQSDNQVLNLTPFEVKYNENRPFFTEGTELFNKGGVFYSRRVGGMPVDYGNINLNANETVVKNPTETRLLNATKLSGRMSNGLAIGVFNAVTQAAYATVQDTLSGNTRSVQTAPLSNYNILVLDQNLKNNSSVSFINTNVTRFSRADYNADVAGLVFNLNNKKNSYGVTGYGFMSNLFYPTSTISGYSYEVVASKTLGSFTWSVGEDYASPNYNPNDLGILYNANYFDHNVSLQYFVYKPTRWFNSWGLWTNFYYSQRYSPWVYQSASMQVGTNLKLKNFWQLNSNYIFRPTATDFYESRNDALPYTAPASHAFNINVNTNSSKKLSGGAFAQYRTLLNQNGGTGVYIETWGTYILNNKLSISADLNFNPQRHFINYFTTDGNNIPVYSVYNRNTVENVISAKYAFNELMNITFRLRHYWSKRINLRFLNMDKSGFTDRSTTDYNSTDDEDFNIINTDVVYTWVFLPGSQFSIAYKNSAANSINPGPDGYLHNAQQIFGQPLNNNVSVKLLYFIDYQTLRKHKKLS